MWTVEETSRRRVDHLIETQERFEAMYRQHEERVLSYALRRAPVEVAKDAVADTFLAAWRRFDELPRDPLPWLIGAARRTLANQRRASARQARLIDRLAVESSARPSYEPARGAAEREELGNALRALSVEDREALALVSWDGLTPSQAAASLGCSPVAFRVRLHRARKRFERELGVLEQRRVSPGTPPGEVETTLKEVS